MRMGFGQTLKNASKQAVLLLAHPNYDLPMEIIPDACGYGIGAVLAQRVDGQDQQVCNRQDVR